MYDDTKRGLLAVMFFLPCGVLQSAPQNKQPLLLTTRYANYHAAHEDA